MARSGKRIRAAVENIDREKLYPLNEAVSMVKELASAKFDESIDAAVNLGVNAKKSDQNVRGATLEDLAETVKSGEIEFDVCIATPDTMRVVGQLGQILGPRGIMPNPKVGTVTTDVTKAVNDAKSGQVQFRIDKAGLIHCPIGKVSFSTEDLEENLNALVTALIKSKPAASKGQYIGRVALSSTMGPGVKVDRTSISAIR